MNFLKLCVVAFGAYVAERLIGPDFPLCVGVILFFAISVQLYSGKLLNSQLYSYILIFSLEALDGWYWLIGFTIFIASIVMETKKLSEGRK